MLQACKASIRGLAAHSGLQLIALAAEAAASTNRKLLPALKLYHVSSQAGNVHCQLVSQTGTFKVDLVTIM